MYFLNIIYIFQYTICNKALNNLINDTNDNKFANVHHVPY